MTNTNEAMDAEQGAALAYFTNSKRGGLLIGAGPVFWVVFCGAALILAIIAGTGLIVSKFRDREIQRSERELENTVQLLARHFDRQIEDFESIQKSLAEEIKGRVKSAEEFRRLLSNEEVHRLLRNKVSDSVAFAGVNLFDADGAFINSSERWPVPSVNVSDRNFFKAFKTGSNTSPVLIELVQSRLSLVTFRHVLGLENLSLALEETSSPLLQPAFPEEKK
jgi:hypothetical protein